MPHIDTDTSSENYPSYNGWKIHQPPPLWEFDESCKNLEPPRKLEDALTDKSKSDTAPPTLNSKDTNDL